MGHLLPESRRYKSPVVILLVLVAWCALVGVVLWQWIHWYDLGRPVLSVVAHVSAFVWWLTLLAAFHYTAFHVGAVWAPSAARRGCTETPAVAVLYTTCDDFDEESCLTCVTEAIRYRYARVLVCDDSVQPDYQARVEAFCSSHASVCELVRRSDRTGFKAGNLNHVIAGHVTEDWFLLADADQRLPLGYLKDVMGVLEPDSAHVAFVQTANTAYVAWDASPFQKAMAPEVDLLHQCDLALKEHAGFLPTLGHSTLVRRASWAAVGGFPEVVSEDLAFSLRVIAGGGIGRYEASIRAGELVPRDFGSFLVRFRKFAAGAAELLRHEAARFVLAGSVTTVEKWDGLVWLGRYGLMPVFVVNGFVSAFVCWSLWSEGSPYIQPFLPYVYAWLFLASIAARVLAAASWGEHFRYHFWATAIYSASMPLAGWSFVKHLFVRPTFCRTPKGPAGTALARRHVVAMLILGSAALTCAIAWRSPFSPFLAAQGTAYLCFPLFGQLCSSTWLGILARIVIYVPGLLAVIALVALWQAAW